jgi:hypothetical protein
MFIKLKLHLNLKNKGDIIISAFAFNYKFIFAFIYAQGISTYSRLLAFISGSISRCHLLFFVPFAFFVVSFCRCSYEIQIMLI